MITYIDKDNANKYSSLFNEAEAVLRYHGLIDADTHINSLNDYFSHIKDLLDLGGNDADKNIPVFEYVDGTLQPVEGINRQYDGMRFSMLPVDEEVFFIHANERTIDVPASFKKNGVAVQGDQVAEVVYFKIDRFFDATDLATQSIIIEWIAPGEDKNSSVKGYSIPSVVDFESDPRYVVFGWPLSTDITKRPGTVTFAVRFYTFDQDLGGAPMRYSLSTLTQTVEVKAGINLNIESALADSPTSDLIYRGTEIKELMKNRAVNSNFSYADKAEVPAFGEMPDPVIYLHYNAEEDKWEAVEVRASAAASDLGNITYLWTKFAYDGGEGSLKDGQAYNIAIEYPPEKKDEAIALAQPVDENDTKLYRLYSDEECKNPISLEDYKNADPVPTVYIKASACKLDEVGLYMVTAINRVGSVTAKKTEKFFIVCRPANASLVLEEQEAGTYRSVIVDDENRILSVATQKESRPCVEPGVVLPEGQDLAERYEFNPDKEVIRYRWFKANELAENIQETVWTQIDTGVNDNPAKDKVNLILTEDDPTGYYYCEVVGELNGNQADVPSDNKLTPWRITGPAAVPTIRIYAANEEKVTNPDANKLEDLDEAKKEYCFFVDDVKDETTQLQVEVQGLDKASDSYTVEWYYYELGNRTLNKEPVVQDLYDAIRGVYKPSLQAEYPYPLDLKVGEGEVYKPEKDGYYFCIVSNVYNGDEAVPVSSAIVNFNSRKDSV